MIAIENVRLFNETREALERQTATAEILKVIAQSPGDVQPVLDAIVASAKRLVDGYSATVWQLDGELLRLTAFTQTGEQAARALQRFSDGLVVGDAFAMDPLRTGLPIQMADVLTDPRATEEHRELARVRGFHAVTNVPLVREGVAIGMISVTRVEAGEFTPHQLELLQTFADQAVIAIENVRLFNETREALERQTATAEVLKVISESPTDVQPVFDTIAERAAKLTGAESGIVFRYDGEWIHQASSYGIDSALIAELSTAMPARIDAHFMSARAIREGVVINEPDLQGTYVPNDDVPERLKDVARKAGLRGGLCVPMFRDRQAVGAIAMYRNSPGKFADSEVDLLRTFAAQAVIAIENVRLFNETREALEQQTATADVLRVISGSVSDTAPVFDEILHSCQRLFATGQVGIALVGDDGMMHFDEHLKDANQASAGRSMPTRRSRRSSRGRSVIRSTATRSTSAGCSTFRTSCTGRTCPPGCAAPPSRWATSRCSSRRCCGTTGASGRFGGPCAAGGVLRQGRRPAQDLRRPGGHRDPERAAVQRDPGGAGAADRHRRASCA